jgi:hypothetical protein
LVGMLFSVTTISKDTIVPDLQNIKF